MCPTPCPAPFKQRVQARELKVHCLSKLQHECIVKYFGTERTEDQICIFLEYMPEVSCGTSTLYSSVKFPAFWYVHDL